MSFSALDSDLLGPLFATGEMREAFSDVSFLAAMLEVEVALAEGLEAAGLVPAGLAAALRAIAPESLDIPALGAETALAGVPVIPFVKAIERRLPPALAPFVHFGATTQDIFDTARTLQMRRALLLLLPELSAILDGLGALAEQHARTPCVGRTYGQHAAPTSFGAKVAVWIQGIAELAHDWNATFRRASTLSLHGPVGTAAAFDDKFETIEEAVRKRLVLSGTKIPRHTDRGAVVEIGLWLARLMGVLGKMATDIASLASTEIGEAREAHLPGRGGSSAMPHKRNPVGSTVILAAASAAKGHALILLDAMLAAHERPAGAWHAEWHALPALFGLASGALREARAIARGLDVDTARMRANLELTRGLIFADRAAALLAPRLGRAEAHAFIERACHAAQVGGLHLRDALSRDPALVDGADLEAAFDMGPALEAAARVAEAGARKARQTVEIIADYPS